MVSGGTVRPTGVVVAQIKRLRRRRGVNTATLAARCAELGAPEVTDQVVRNIEIGRRTISVDHLCMLALALDVAPVHLLTPEDDQDDVQVQVTSTQCCDARTWTSWVHGATALPGTNQQAFFGYAVEHAKPEEGQAVFAAAKAHASQAVTRVMAQVQTEAALEITQVRTSARNALDTVIQAARSGDPQTLETAIQQAQQALSPPPSH
jgi:transcriptional regulator with XRE-family HTH domain